MKRKLVKTVASLCLYLMRYCVLLCTCVCVCGVSMWVACVEVCTFVLPEGKLKYFNCTLSMCARVKPGSHW